MANNYLIIGDDEYIRESEVNKIKNKFLSSSETELNYSVHAPNDIDGIMDSLGTMPFIADKRVILVKDAEELSEESSNTISSYLENPTGTSVLIISSGGSFKKSKQYKKLSKLVSEIEADKPTPEKMKNWVRSYFKKEGIEISPRAVNLIVELKGTDTPGVKMELDKLASFSGGERIEVEHVEQIVGRSVTETVFKLVDAINAGDGKWVFRIINDLYDQKKQPPEIIGYLGWYIRIMQKIRLLSERGMEPGGLASELGYSPAYARRLVGQSKKYPVKRIERWVSLLLETDRDIKTGRKEASVALEMLIASLLEG
ncbi:DNA polymerase III subunit delta [Candidatus Omnitrophota bacterium]